MAVLKASVIICTYNRADRISRILEQISLLDYPADSFEIIVVDNNSLDNTSQVIKEFAAGSKIPILYFNEKRKGITFARNRGAEESHFPYLVYIDDDCSMNSDWLSLLVQGFSLQDDVMVVAGRIEVDYDNQIVPKWLGKKAEQWLAKYNYPGSDPRILENPEYVCEGNMAITHQAWKLGGGFQGMDQVGSPHVASNENRLLVERIKAKNGKIAFVPGAIVFHHTKIPEKKQLLYRVYWNGVSEGILDYILGYRNWYSKILKIFRNIAALTAFLFYSLFFLIFMNEAEAMYYLLLSVYLVGLILSELHLAGDWSNVRSWVSKNAYEIN